jgi:hypothetical protein
VFWVRSSRTFEASTTALTLYRTKPYASPSV